MVFDDLWRHLEDPHELRLIPIYSRCDRRRRSCARKREYDYGAGGGNFIGVSVGADVNSGVGDADEDSDGDLVVAVGDSKGTAVAAICSDDIGDAFDVMERRSLENGISAIRATNIGTTTPQQPPTSSKIKYSTPDSSLVRDVARRVLLHASPQFLVEAVGEDHPIVQSVV